MTIIVECCVDALKGNIEALLCLIGFSDSSSTVGWMNCLKFDDVAKLIMNVTHKS